MTQAQAKEFVTKSYPAAPLVMLPATIVSADFKLDTVTGFVFDMNSSQTNDPVLAQQGVDRAKILFNPPRLKRHHRDCPHRQFRQQRRYDHGRASRVARGKYGRPVNSKNGA